MMKNTHMLLMIILIIASCRSNGQSITSNYSEKIRNDSISNKYTILKINEVDDKLYVIYAQKGDSIYKIVSEKEKYPPITCSLIKETNIEILDLILIFPQKSLLGVELSGSYNTTVKGINVNGVMVEIEESSNNSLYRASNLNGLCLNKKVNSDLY